MAKERGQPEPVLHARGLVWEKELTGAAVLPPALRQQMLRRKRRPEGTATRRAPSPSLSSPACRTRQHFVPPAICTYPHLMDCR